MQPLKAETINAISAVPALEWDSCTEGNPFVAHAFLKALEETGCVSEKTGWQPCHLKLTGETDQLIGYIPLYLKSHSYGEYVFDHNWAAAFERAGGRYYPKLQASVPFSPVNSPKLLVSPHYDRQTAQSALLGAAITIAEQYSVSSLHLTFLPEEEATCAQEAGLLLRHDQQFHWHNKDYRSFDDFLAALSSRKRKQVKKERATALASGITIEVLPGADITAEHLDAFYSFYLDTSARKWGQPYLSHAFFAEIVTNMPASILLFLCKRSEKYIAGALNLIGNDTLYGRYWGCIEEHPCLHFETCYYQAIEYAIQHNIKLIEAGAQGAHKLARGYEPMQTTSAHWVSNPGFRSAVAEFLTHETAAVKDEINYLTEHIPFKK